MRTRTSAAAGRRGIGWLRHRLGRSRHRRARLALSGCAVTENAAGSNSAALGSSCARRKSACLSGIIGSLPTAAMIMLRYSGLFTASLMTSFGDVQPGTAVLGWRVIEAGSGRGASRGATDVGNDNVLLDFIAAQERWWRVTPALSKADQCANSRWQAVIWQHARGPSRPRPHDPRVHGRGGPRSLLEMNSTEPKSFVTRRCGVPDIVRSAFNHVLLSEPCAHPGHQLRCGRIPLLGGHVQETFLDAVLDCPSGRRTCLTLCRAIRSRGSRRSIDRSCAQARDRRSAYRSLCSWWAFLALWRRVLRAPESALVFRGFRRQQIGRLPVKFLWDRWAADSGPTATIWRWIWRSRRCRGWSRSSVR